MQFFRSYQYFSSAVASSCILTVGNFDGMHLGHQALFSQMKALADEQGIPTVVLIFEPQPSEFFQPATAGARLSTLREKMDMLSYLGIDHVICQRFDQTFAMLSADEFVKDILVKHLQVKTLFVGNDFHFGFQRQGNVALLQRAGKQLGFEVIEAPQVLYAGERISSTRIRQCLAGGDLSQVGQLLGRPYSMKGRVIHGDKRGRLLGFPTANFASKRRVVPVSGVFIVCVHGLDHVYYGVANVGKRPTLDGIRQLLEVHLFNFDQDIYGRALQVDFLAKLREERRFADISELQAQIARDCLQARTVLSSCGKLEVL